MPAGETIFGYVVMAGGTVAAIAFLDFILSNLPDAIDEFADSDSRTATIRNEIIDGTKNPRAETERGSGLVGGTGASVLSKQKGAPNTSRPLGGASR